VATPKYAKLFERAEIAKAKHWLQNLAPYSAALSAGTFLPLP